MAERDLTDNCVTHKKGERMPYRISRFDMPYILLFSLVLRLLAVQIYENNQEIFFQFYSYLKSNSLIYPFSTFVLNKLYHSTVFIIIPYTSSWFHNCIAFRLKIVRHNSTMFSHGILFTNCKFTRFCRCFSPFCHLGKLLKICYNDFTLKTAVPFFGQLSV